MRRLLVLFASVFAAAAAQGASGRYDSLGADDVRHVITRTPEALEVRVLGAGVDRPEQALFVALGGSSGEGSPQLPAEPGEEGSPVWLPFAADLLVSARDTADGKKVTLRRWEKTAWGPRKPDGNVIVSAEPAQVSVRIPAKLLGDADRLVVYLKDLATEGGRGRLYGAVDRATASGTGERTIRHYLAMDTAKDATTFRRAGRTSPDGPRTRICGVPPRLSGKTDATRRPDGAPGENGDGKSGDLDDAALAELKNLGFTHLCLTGAGGPGDKPAGSGGEFQSLLDRIHGQGLQVIVDFVPGRAAGRLASGVQTGSSVDVDGESDIAVVDTREKMDTVIARWQDLGVDGFRAGMAHMVPPEIWHWLIVRARQRDPGVYFVAAAGAGGDVRLGLLAAGFDAVYDNAGFDALDELSGAEGTDKEPHAFLFDNTLRRAGNRGGAGVAPLPGREGRGMAADKPAAALLFGLSRGPVMVCHGLETGEPEPVDGDGVHDDEPATTGGDRSGPESAPKAEVLAHGGGRRAPEQSSLREYYRRLLHLADLPALRDGDFYPLQPASTGNPAEASDPSGTGGPSIRCFLRHDVATGQKILVVANLHPDETVRDVRIRFPGKAMRFLGWDTIAGSQTVPVIAGDRLGEVSGGSAAIRTTPAEMENPGLPVAALPPLTAAYYELQAPR